MKVQMVSVQVRYSKPQAGGAYKTMELGAEAALEPQEALTEALGRLYGELRAEMGKLWQQNGHQPEGEVPPRRAAPRQAREATSPARPVCPVHHKAKEGRFGLYCPAKGVDGTWCKWRATANTA